jgi:hypothetical protein
VNAPGFADFTRAVAARLRRVLSPTPVTACPVCRSYNIQSSRLASHVDWLRVRLTGRSPYRCRDCDTRGWAREIAEAPAHWGHGMTCAITDEELDRFDVLLPTAVAPQPGPFGRTQQC